MQPLTLVSLLFALVLTPSIAFAAEADLFVAPDGRDTWSGKLAAPNAAKTDGPLATPNAAVEAVRKLLPVAKSAGRPVVVKIRGGLYLLEKPLVFGPEDSGAEGSAVVFESYPGERPILSGGTRIDGWQVRDGRWVAHLPQVAAGEWRFSQLWVNGERRYRPRLPKGDYYTIAEAVQPSADATGFDAFAFAPGDIRADWSNLEDVEVLGFQIWTMARLRVKSVDAAANVVRFTGPTRGKDWWASLPKGNRYIVENVKEALSKPGEWYLDRPSGELTYIPMPGEKPGSVDVFAPRLERLVELRGNPAKRQWVSSIVFRGLVFAHTNWNSPPQGNSFPQAEVNLSAAISGSGARDCSLEACVVAGSGEYAVEFGEGCKRNRVVDCVLTDMAAGGVKIGTTGYSEDDEVVASHNVVRNCRIGPGGRMHPAGIGVWLGHSCYNEIDHNDIFDFYYTGVSTGWSWGYGPSNCNHNTVSNNHIWQLGQRVLSDMGGIYTLGLSPGSVLHHNRIHDVQSFSYGGWGIYPDEGTSTMLIENNVAYGCKSAGFHQHYGRENVVRNNVWALNHDSQLMRTRMEAHLSFTFEHNIVYWTEGALLGSNWSDNNYKLDHNLYWNAAGKPVDFAGLTFEKWQAKGQDAASLIADPLFVDPSKGDFRLKPGSPAEKIGFVPIDLTRNGCLTPLPAATHGSSGDAKAIKLQLKNAPPAFPLPQPPAAAGGPIADPFEDTPVGRAPRSFTVSEEDGQHTIRITDEAAASGSRCLKLVDGPGQKANYNPHLYYDPVFETGTILGAFDLRVEKGAFLYHEWRDAANPYHVGPSITVRPDGSVNAGDKKLFDIPPGKWVRFEISCSIGPNAPGSYDLTVKLPGRVPAMRFKGLPCSPEFRSLRWYGFTMDGDADAVAYLDNISLKPKGR